jgi:DNA-binding response OmpR family regulator
MSRFGEVTVLQPTNRDFAEHAGWPATFAILVVMDRHEDRDEVLRRLGYRRPAPDWEVRPAAPSDLLEVGEVRIDRRTHRVHSSGRELVLTTLEFRLLVTLAEQPDSVLSRGILLRDVWGLKEQTATRTVDAHIKRLRAKLGRAGRLIETVRGVGYRLAVADDAARDLELVETQMTAE